jgi:hypothetical protein
MKAWQLLDSREKWCQGRMRKSNGARCALAAIIDIYGAFTVESYTQQERMRACVSSSIGEWNDTHTYEEVHALLKELDI